MSLHRSVLALALMGLSMAFAPGCAAEAEDVDAAEADVSAKRSDAQIQAAIEKAAEGAIYVSENDYPFSFVRADKAAGDTKTISQTLVRSRFAEYVENDPDADKPLASLYGMERSFAEWKAEYVPSDEQCNEDTFPGPEECAAMRRLNDALDKNLRDVKVFYFGADGGRGHVDGTGVSIFIVGRTPSGNYAGVRTIAIWT